MIAPKLVPHVQPTGRDYSGNTSPDLITAVPAHAEAVADDREAGRIAVSALVLSAAGIAAALLLLALTIAGWPSDGPQLDTWTHGNYRQPRTLVTY
jgi:hypothetical protein